MIIAARPSEFSGKAGKFCLAVGVFDGVHLGHQQVIRQALADARQHQCLAVAITFDRHPAQVVAPERAPLLIYPLAQKLETLAAMQLDGVWLIRFDEAFSRIEAENFVRLLAREFGRIHSICVGSTFTFGHKRAGNVDLLRRLGEEFHFQVHGLAAVALDGNRVSSTRIREAIRTGELDSAGQMLGRPYSLRGRVVKGDRLGSKIGFPTANLDFNGIELPPNGVYAARVRRGADDLKAVLNIGLRPTVSGGASPTRFEVHLLDFAGDLYGEEIEVTFVEFLRPEIKFPSIDALRKQITTDAEQARRLLD